MATQLRGQYEEFRSESRSQSEDVRTRVGQAQAKTEEEAKAIREQLGKA